MSLTPEQMEARRHFIGASEIAALTGHSHWLTPWALWRAKVEGVQSAGSFKTELGDLLEPVVLELYRRRTGRWTAPAGTMRHPDFPVGCTPDAIAGDESDTVRVVQCKTCDPWVKDRFGEPGTDQIDPAYVVQVQLEMFVTGARIADVPVLFGTQSFEIYTVAYDEELATGLVKIAADWWARHVETKTPPPIDETPACSSWLAQQWTPRAPLKVADEQAAAIARELRQFRAAAAHAEKEAERRANLLKQIIADGEGLEGPDFKITWRASKSGKRSFRPTFNGEVASNE